MKFPTINTIEDVLPHIEGKTEFVVAEREGFTVINYMVNFGTDTFPDLPTGPDATYEDYDHAAILRECRGIMFDREGKLISRPYHKFFNINEREETLASEFDLYDPEKYVFMDKLDGSFIRPVRIDGIIRLCTKMGITDQSHQAEEFLEGLDDETRAYYYEFFESYVDHFTPIFEFCSRKNQVVIDYPEDALILTGLRHNASGKYISYKHLKLITKVFHIPLVKALSIDDMLDESVPRCITRVIDVVKAWKGVEGIVLRYTDGRMAKLKADDYCEKHGAKDALLLEKNLLRFYLEGKLDDYIPLLDDQFRARVEAYTGAVAKGIELSTMSAEATVRWVQKQFDTRREQAQFVTSEIHPVSRSIIFNGLDGKDIRAKIIEKVLSNTSSQTLVDEMRPFLGDAKWL